MVTFVEFGQAGGDHVPLVDEVIKEPRNLMRPRRFRVRFGKRLLCSRGYVKEGLEGTCLAFCRRQTSSSNPIPNRDR